MPRRRGIRDWSRAIAWVALAVALYGALLSTVQWRESRAQRMRRLRVSLFVGTVRSGGVQHRKGLVLRAVNPGYEKVVATTAGVLLPDGWRVAFDHPEPNLSFPLTIEGGGNVYISAPAKALVQLCRAMLERGFTGKVVLTGYFEDGLGECHRSDPLLFDIDEALRLGRAQMREAVGGEVSGGSP